MLTEHNISSTVSISYYILLGPLHFTKSPCINISIPAPDLQIRGLRWLNRIDRKEFLTLFIETDSAEHANRLIPEGVIMGYNLKLTERYDSKYRITPCFKCQKSGHISSIFLNAQKCGFCGEGRSTESCADKTQAMNKKCSGCNGGNQSSWSKDCPVELKS